MNPIGLVHNGFKAPTKEAAELKDELIKRGVKVYVELNDGYKHVDLALPNAKLNIEVDGIHHLTNPQQIVTDLSCGYYSNKLGYSTLHIPNEMIRLHLQEIADALTEASKKLEQKIKVHLTK
jgi:very-short-patch-repair endonuclease